MLKCVDEAPISHRRNLGLTLGEESSLDSVLMLHDCVGERLTLRVVLKYGPCKFAKIPIFGCKLPFLCVLMQK